MATSRKRTPEQVKQHAEYNRRRYFGKKEWINKRRRAYRKRYYDLSRTHPMAVPHFKDRALRQQHKITLEQYKEMHRLQGGRCASCSREIQIFGGRGIVGHVDHDHITGKNRGLLCLNCNVALGLLKDDPLKVKVLLDYILRYHE